MKPSKFAARLLPHTSDTTVEELAKTAREAADVPLLRGHHLRVTIPAGGTVAIPHKLGRTPRYWQDCGRRGGCLYWEIRRDSRVLELQSADPVDIELDLLVVP
jgi:hypothetical protein